MDQKDLLRKEIRQLEIALSRSTSHCSQSPSSGKGDNNADVNVKPKSPLSSGSRALAQKAWRERHEAERAARALAMSELEQRAVLKVKLKNAQAITKLRSQQANRRKVEHHEPSTLADSIELSSPLSITAVEESAAGTLEAAVKDLNKAIEESRDANQSEALSLELKTMDESNAVAKNSLSVDNDDLFMHSSDINSNVADTLTSHSRWEKIKTNLSNVVLSTKGGFDLEAITTESSQEDKNEPALVLSSLSSMKLSINLENEDEEPFQFVPAPIPPPPPPPPPPPERLSSKKARSLWAVIRRNIGNISVASQGGFDALQSGHVASQSSIDLLEKINSSEVLNDEEDSESSAGTDEILAMLP